MPGAAPPPGAVPGPFRDAPRRDGPVLVAVGLRAEARLLPDSPDLLAVCAGGDPHRLAEALRRAAAGGGVRAVLSFGICGGLDPALPPGALVVATAVHRPDEAPLPADAAWAAAIARGCLSAGLLPQLGPVAAAAAVVADPAAKRTLRARTGALAVDLESGAAASLAQALGVPFAALRAVADTARESLPAAAAAGLTPDGDPDLPAVLRALRRRPSDLPGLLRAARRAACAMRALRRAVLAADAGWLTPPDRTRRP